VDDKVIERPQHMFMRVAIGIHGDDIKDVLETYDGMTQKMFLHATPTLFNFGTPKPQGSSCFLLHANDDSIHGIYESLSECASISKHAGGIGIHIHNIRGKNSEIRGTHGKSDGIIPMLRVFNSTARYVNQSGRRNGSIAVYLEPWHSDIEGFLDLKKNHGNEEERARDLFYALWIPDLFMERVKANGVWSLMCPDECKQLSDVYGETFKELYETYEAQGKYKKQLKAQDLWIKILESQIETGTPYMLYKDSINRKSNQKNLGIIKSSNLCTEIVQYTSPEEIAVCNLASICLPSYVENINGELSFNFEKLGKYSKIVCKNLNKIIDKNFYPLEKARVSNLKHRPIGIGVQGLSDVYMLLKLPYESEKAKQLNRDIFETIYYHSLCMSMEISKKREEIIQQLDSENYNINLNEYEVDLKKYKGAYSSFDGSPLSQGVFQFDLWGVKANMYDWEQLRKDVMQYGARNSLLLAPMPTASTSQIMGFTESFEIPTSNIYKRKTLAGEFIIINKYLITDLIDLGLWNNAMKENILIGEGSIQHIQNIPSHIKELYKTAWEVKQKVYIDQAKDRSAFICQSQSMNLFVDVPTFNKLNSMHFYTWNSGLKTGMYYLRTKPKATTQQFTIDPTKSKSNVIVSEEPEVCESCSA
jgi:ribonucleoside-diphosphate reductase alpha chain